MKNLIFAISMLIGLNIPAMAQLEHDIMKGSTFIPQEGTILIYEVDFYGNNYDFLVLIHEIKKDKVVFEYLMTNPNQTSGSITITADALESATSQFNFFGGGPVTLEDMTSVWISRKVFDELTGEKGRSIISPDGGQTSVELIGKKVGYDYSIYNHISERQFDNIAYYYAESVDGDIKYWIGTSRGVPIILKMDLGWKIWLREMARAEEE
jgi:hypothetical protein